MAPTSPSTSKGRYRRTHHEIDRRRRRRFGNRSAGRRPLFSERDPGQQTRQHISNAGYHGRASSCTSPRIEWGVGMAEKTIRTGLCPGGRLRMERLLRLLQTGRVDPTRLTTHTFRFDDLERAFDMMERKLDGIIKPLILF